MVRKLFLGSCSAALLVLGACSTQSVGRSTTTVMRQDVNELELDPVPGTVNDVWVEKMVDTVRVPGKLDPKGVYYRKGHTEVVEVRQGRFQLVEYPDDQKSGQPAEHATGQ